MLYRLKSLLKTLQEILQKVDGLEANYSFGDVKALWGILMENVEIRSHDYTGTTK